MAGADFTETTRRLEDRLPRHAAARCVADTVRLPDGGTAVREYIHHPGACMVIAFLDERDDPARAPVPLSAAAPFHRAARGQDRAGRRSARRRRSAS